MNSKIPAQVASGFLQKVYLMEKWEGRYYTNGWVPIKAVMTRMEAWPH